MKLADIKKKAKTMGIDAGKSGKTDLVRAIQTAENNTPCFDSGRRDCDQVKCCWRNDCLSEEKRVL